MPLKLNEITAQRETPGPPALQAQRGQVPGESVPRRLSLSSLQPSLGTAAGDGQEEVS